MTTVRPPGLIVSIGEVLIDLVAVERGAAVEDASTFRKAAGGAPANVAVGASRLGRRAAFIGKVAEDGFGRFLRSVLVTEGVDVSGLVADPVARTPLAFVGAGSSSERAFVFYHRGMADTLLRPDELETRILERARILHFGSVTLVADPGRTATLEAVRISRSRGALISFDPNVRLELWDRPEAARAAIVAALPLADLVKVSHEELEWLTGTEDVALGSDRLAEHGPRLVVVTLGADGAYFRTTTGRSHVPGFPVEVVDATGAGDAFVSAFLSELDASPDPHEAVVDGDALPRAVTVANAAGALATTMYGAIPSLPRRDAIDRLLAGEPDRRPSPRPGTGETIAAEPIAAVGIARPEQ